MYKIEKNHPAYLNYQNQLQIKENQDATFILKMIKRIVIWLAFLSKCNTSFIQKFIQQHNHNQYLIDKNDALPEIVGHLAGTCYDENIIMDYGINYIKLDIIHMSL